MDDRLEAVVVADRQRLVPEQVDAGVAEVVAARRGLQHVTADHPAVGLELLQHLRQVVAAPVVVDRLADGGDARAGGVVEAGAGADAARGDLDVPPGGGADLDERALRGLVRRLVLGEAHVAVGTEHLGVAELLGERGAQGDHRPSHGVVVGALVLLPVRPGVVHLEVVVEVEGLAGESGELGRHVIETTWHAPVVVLSRGWS